MTVWEEKQCQIKSETRKNQENFKLDDLIGHKEFRFHCE